MHGSKEKEFILLKNLVVGSFHENYEDIALMPKGDHFVVVDNLVVGATIYDLYKFVQQPEHCQHNTCGFTGKKNEKGHYIKPKCVYISYRKLTHEEAAKPDMSSIFIGLYVQYLQDGDLRSGTTVYDTAKEKFIDYWLQDGGNERLVIENDHNRPSVVLPRKSNYEVFVERMKKLVF